MQRGEAVRARSVLKLFEHAVEAALLKPLDERTGEEDQPED